MCAFQLFSIPVIFSFSCSQSPTSLSFTMMLILTLSLFFMIVDGRCVCSWHEIQPLGTQVSNKFYFWCKPAGDSVSVKYFWFIYPLPSLLWFACKNNVGPLCVFFFLPTFTILILVLIFLHHWWLDDPKRLLIYRNWSCNRRKDSSYLYTDDRFGHRFIGATMHG